MLLDVRFGNPQRSHPDGSAKKKVRVQLLCAIKQVSVPAELELRRLLLQGVPLWVACPGLVCR